ncbi:MAG TPA: hypothetical protein QGF05_12365, partial [Dehalococcoidia bacterium]|nr:hypothetical protein [Dehalococcoidia bacterium]
MAEFLEMRYGARLAATFSVIGGVVCILFAGMGVLAIGKIVAGLTTLSVEQSIALISLIVGAYVFSGGMMSALLTDLLQGLMCLFILSFVMLPFLWMEVGGMASLRTLPPSTWDLAGEGMTLWTVLALNASALVGGVAAPWIYNWIAVSRDERAATQCGWGHLWKRVITLLFALYGILFAIYDPGLADGELAWGQVMGQLLPVGLLGLLVASFFAAAMSSADAWATTSSAMHVDYLYRKVLRRGRSLRHYLRASRVWAAASIGLAALCALQVETIRDILNMSMSLLGFLGLPIYFGVYWRRANRLGMWLSLTLGMGAYVTIMLLMTGTGRTFPDSASAFPWG